MTHSVQELAQRFDQSDALEGTPLEESSMQTVKLCGAFGVVSKAQKDAGASTSAVEAARLLALEDDCRECQVPLNLNLDCAVSGFGLISLEATVAESGPLRERATAEVALNLFTALAHLHSQGVLHRNVIAENILLDPSGSALLSGLAHAASLDDIEALNRRVGTPGFMPPEVLVGSESSIGVDSFGAGATLFFALSGEPPFNGDLPTRIRKTARLKVSFDTSGRIGGASQVCRETLKALMQRNPQDRPSAAEILDGPWWPREVTQEP